MYDLWDTRMLHVQQNNNSFFPIWKKEIYGRQIGLKYISIEQTIIFIEHIEIEKWTVIIVKTNILNHEIKNWKQDKKTRMQNER